MRIVYYNYIQAEAVTKLRTFADACAYPSAKRITVHGSTGPVNAVEADGTLFIQNDEAEAEAIRSKAMEAASEVVAATTAAAFEVAAPRLVPEPAVEGSARDPEPCCAAAFSAVIKSSSYDAVVSKPSVRPKLSDATSQPAVGGPQALSTAASKPAAVLTPLEVNIVCTRAVHVHRVYTCAYADTIPQPQEPDDLLVAQNPPLPKDIIEFAGDTVRDPPLTASTALVTVLFLMHCNLSAVHVRYPAAAAPDPYRLSLYAVPNRCRYRGISLMSTPVAARPARRMPSDTPLSPQNNPMRAIPSRTPRTR